MKFVYYFHKSRYFWICLQFQVQSVNWTHQDS